jgi:hypothetical protein
LNLSLVRQGQAFAYRQYLKAPCNPAAYLEAERQAESQRLGVWQVPGGITRPWSFRRGGRSSGSTSSSGRLTCRSIGSYARAQDLLRQGHTYLDRDGDGQACESLR